MVSASHSPAPIRPTTNTKATDVDGHAVAIIVGAVAALEFGEIVRRRRNRCRHRRGGPPRESHHPRLVIGRRRLVAGHDCTSLARGRAPFDGVGAAPAHGRVALKDRWISARFARRALRRRDSIACGAPAAKFLVRRGRLSQNKPRSRGSKKQGSAFHRACVPNQFAIAAPKPRRMKAWSLFSQRRKD